MKKLEIISTINNTYSPIINAVLTQWERREGALVFRARSDDNPLATLGDLFHANLPTEGLGDGLCATCNSFVNTYGDLVYHDRKGKVHSAIWNPDHVPPKYKRLFTIMRDAVLEAFHTPQQSGPYKSIIPAAAINLNVLPYFSEERIVGKMQHGGFNHFYLNWGDETYDPSELRGKYNDNISFIAWFLSEPNRMKRLERMREYVKVTDILADNNRLIAALEDMTEVMSKWKEGKLVAAEDYEARHRALVGYARGNAHLLKSEGTKQIRGGAAGVFFESVGDPDDIPNVALVKFMKMTDPENYKRITRDFEERTLRQAEELMVKAGIDKTIKRRCVRKDEKLDFIWEKEVTKKENQLSFLSSLVNSDKNTVNAAQDREHRKRQVSWTTFVEKYMPRLKDMFLVPPSTGNYGGMMTSAEPEAPNLFYWDGPLSVWFYNQGSHPTTWGLEVGELVPIKGVMKSPEHSAGVNPMFRNRDLLVLEKGHHINVNSLGMFKDYLDKYKFDYANLANIIASCNERMSVPVDEESVVVYSVDQLNHHVVIFAELDRVWTRFEITSWE